MVFGADLMAMIEAGAGLLVGTASPDGEPRAARAWAATVVDPTARRLRVAVSGDDPLTVANLASGRVAVTGADVRTYRSVQCKGRVVAVEPPSAEDVELVRTQSTRFFEAIHLVDGNPIELLRRILPHELVVIEVVVEEEFDQTPGPQAGAALARP